MDSPSASQPSARQDANRLALRAIKQVLTANVPTHLTVEGSQLELTSETLGAPVWPAEGLKGLDPSLDGPLPAPRRVRCTWDGGSVELQLRCSWWPLGRTYSQLLGIGISFARSNQDILWSTVALPVQAARDGADAPVYFQFSLFKRKDEEEKEVLDRWGIPLKALVERSGLELASPWRIRPFSVRVPTGEAVPDANRALRDLLHLALLKAPFAVRGDVELFGGALPFALPQPGTVTSKVPAQALAASTTEKRLGIWPLPGGVREYKATLDALLGRLAEHPTTEPAFYALLLDEYEISGETAQQGYLRFLTATGLASFDQSALQLTDEGRTYLAQRDPADLFEVLHRRFEGVLATLAILEQEGRLSATRAHEMLTAVLGTDWSTKNQSAFRRNWLLSLGALDRDSSGDALTELGRTLLAKHDAECKPLRERIAEFIENEGPDIGDDSAAKKEERADPWILPVSQEAGAPSAWSSERLDLKAEHIQPQLEKLRLRLPAGLIERAAASLSAGKHLLLVGPPGTGKTELAHALAEAARAEGYCHGAFVATASADWTTFDTIGGYGLERNNELRFRPGAFLRAVERHRWFVVDEVNRADIDRAFGELMTVLAGRATATPYTLDDERIVKIGPEEDCTHRVPPTFRVIATMNTWDKTSLFRLSYAVQRRFAILHVGLPDDATYAALVGEHGKRELRDPRLSDTAIERLTRIFRHSGLLKHRQVGPAVAIDMIRYMQRRQTDGDALAEALAQYVLPQLEGLEQETAVAVHGLLLGTLGGWASEAASNELRERFCEAFPSYRFG